MSKSNIVPLAQITGEEEIPTMVSEPNWLKFQEDIRKKNDTVIRIRKLVVDEWLTTFPAFSVIHTVILQPPTSTDRTKPFCPGILIVLYAKDNDTENIQKRKDVVHKLSTFFPNEFSDIRFVNLDMTKEPK